MTSWRREQPFHPPSRLRHSELTHFCLPICKGTLIGAAFRHSPLSAVGYAAYFCLSQHMARSIGSERSHIASPSFVHSGGGMGDDLTRWDQAVDRLVASLDLSAVCVGSSSASSSVSSGRVSSLVEAKSESWSCSQKQEILPTQVSCDETCTTLVSVTKERIDSPLRSHTQELKPTQASGDSTCTTLVVVPKVRGETPTTPPKRARVGIDPKASTRTRREKIALTLPIPAPRRFKRRYQARWKPIELSDDTHAHLHDVLTILNARNVEGRKHDIGIAHNDVLDFTPCFTVHEKGVDFKLKRSVPGFTLFCAKCGRVSPIREKFQITNTSCPIRPKSTLPPRWRTNKLTDEAFLKLQNGLT
eukprot:3249276-Amphidinium_carterae.1